MKKIIKTIAVLLTAILTIALLMPTSAEAASKNGKKNKKYTVTLFDTGSYSYVQRSGKYKGEMKDGVPDGQGTFSLTNKSGVNYTVSGIFKDGVPDGDITMQFDKTEGFSLVKREQTYKNGVIKSFYDMYDNGEREWYSYDGINTGKGYYVIYKTSTGYKETFHVNESGETTMDAFDNLYLNDFLMPGFCGADLDLNDFNVFALEKKRVASKSAIKKKAKNVSGKTIMKNPEKYEGKVIMLENAVMEEYMLYADENDTSNVIFEGVTFSSDGYRYTLFFEPGTVKYKEGKAVDLYYLSFGATTFLTGDETYESRMTGWILKKPTKTAQTSSE